MDNDDDDEDNDDDEDDYSCNSVNFQARTSRFGMEVDLDNTYNMMIMILMMMMMFLMMIKMIIAVTQSIFKQGPPHFAWQ